MSDRSQCERNCLEPEDACHEPAVARLKFGISGKTRRACEEHVKEAKRRGWRAEVLPLE